MANDSALPRVGVVTDATCDLPDEFLRAHQVELLPFTIRMGNDIYIDDRDPQATARFYGEQIAVHGVRTEPAPFTAEQIRQRFLQRIVLEYDYVFCVTISSSRSSMFENATKASFAILSDYKSVRNDAHVPGSFALRVVDSQNLLAGTGVLVAEAARLAQSGTHPNEVRKRLDSLREHICAYLVPGDLQYLRTRGKERGDVHIGLLSYAIDTALKLKPVILCFRGETQVIAKVRSRLRACERTLQHVARQIERGIDTRHVCVSYGGSLEELQGLPGYAQLCDSAERNNVEVLSSVMSATAAVNMGPGGLSVAYGGELRSFKG